MDCAEFRIALTHLTAQVPVIVRSESHRNLADLQVEFDQLLLRLSVEVVSRAKRRMTRELQLFAHREDANLHSAFALHRSIAREDERRLAEIRLACQRLHFFRRETARVGED